MVVHKIKNDTSTRSCLLASVLFLVSGSAWAAVDASTLPSGASIASGSVSIASENAAMEITQSSQKAIINWQSFDVGSDAQVTFVQPDASSIALNRVLSSTPSTINGSITANGQIWLINPAGVVFGNGSVVNAAGVVASTMDITDQNFLDGNYIFERGNSTASIVNSGTISATDAGYIAFFAPELRNEGILKASLGTIALAAGETVVMTIAQDDGHSITIKVDPAEVKTLIENNAMIVAQNGAVLLSAKAADQLLGATITNTGVIRATGLTEEGGVISLIGADEITNKGTLDASGSTGGTITLAAAETGTTNLSGTITAAGTAGIGGKIIATGDNVIVGDEATIDARGTAGGGEIYVGGSWEGEDSSIQEASMTQIASSAVLDASATEEGDGGTIVVRSDITDEDGITLAYGTFLATGGAEGGDGGRIETSGHYLETTGATGSAAAINGEAGIWLFDPYNVTISSSDTNGSFSSGTWTPSSTSTLSAASIQALLNAGTSVTVTTGSSGSELGDIIVDSALTKSSGSDTSLTLSAANNITLNASITSTVGALDLNLYADNDYSGTGIILLYSDLSTNGGSISFGDGTRITLNGVAGTLVGGDLYVGGSSAQTIATNGGSVSINGQVLIANANGLSMNTNGGDVNFASLVDSGNTYSLVSASTISWADAVTAAASCTVSGATPTCGAGIGDTYLATVTSRLENAVVSMTTYTDGNYQASWLGGKRLVGIGTDAVWRWVTGPEALEDSGNGLGFFTQSGSGGTTIEGLFSNWNSGEPNNSGGATLADAGETTIQTLGSSGRWNDLSGASTSSVNYYVKETNLADSPLAIDAGSGSVTFSGTVGSNKALASLAVTAATTAINGGEITTDGAQTYNSAVTLGSSATTLTVEDGDFTTVSNQTITNATGTSATLNIIASGSVSLTAGTNISSNTGALSVDLVSQGGSLSFGDNATIANNGGTTTLEADSISFGTGASLQGAGTGSLIVKSYSSGRTLGIGPGASGTQNISDSFLSTFIASNSFADVTFGDSTAGTITVAGTHTLTSSLILETAGDIVFASGSSVDLGSHMLGLSLSGAGTASEDNTTSLTAGSALFQGTNGTFTLNNGTNSFGTIAANVSTLNFANQGSLIVGTVDSVNGVTTAGAVSLRALGASADVTLNKPVTTTSGTILITAGNTFINNNSSDTGLVAGGGSNYYVYADTPVGGTRGMTTGSKHYNQTYTGSTPAYASSGSWFFYEIAPTLTVTPTSTSITYGDSDPTVGLTYAGFIDADTDTTSGITGIASSSIEAADLSNAGYRSAGDYTLTLSDIGTLASSLGYAIVLADTPTGTLTVTPKEITISAITVDDKIYDGTTAASIISGGTLSGILSGDESYVTTSGGTATFDTKNVGTGKTVSATAVTLSGEEASNYEVSTTGLSTTASITPATLTYSADEISIYAGNDLPALTGSLLGFVAGDTLANATSGTANWTTSLTDTSTVGSYSITGAGLTASNYIFAQAAGNAAALTIEKTPEEPTVVQDTVIEQNTPNVPAGEAPSMKTVEIPEKSINKGSIVDSSSEPHGSTGQESSSADTSQTSSPEQTTSPSQEKTAPPAADNDTVALTVHPQQETSSHSATGSIVATVTKTDAGFSFALSSNVVTKIAGDVSGLSSEARQENGQSLPSWLSYDPRTQIFSSSNVPDGALPLTLRVLFTDPTGKRAPKTIKVTITK